MIWDKLSPFYDLFENVYNGKTNRGIEREIQNYVKENDIVLECACGTGLLTIPMAQKCRKVIATDYSVGMLKQTRRKTVKYENIRLKQASILELPFKKNCFDVVVAANVIHLLDEPGKALEEMKRVCKVGGTIVIPTYINKQQKNATFAANMLSKLGIDFKRQFDFESYQKFFEDCGLTDVKYQVIDGRMPCAFAIVENR